MYNIDDIKTVHIEATSMCNARCPMCSRYTLDGFLQPGLEEKHIDPEIFYKLFNSLNPIKSVYFSGVYGDPCMHPKLLELCNFLFFRNIDIQIDTNAGYRKPDFWKELADYDGFVNFAVDGLEDTNKIYRKNVSWDAVIANMEAYAKAGGRGRWNFIVFQHNEHQIEEARTIATQLGLDFRTKITQKFRRAKIWDVMINGSKAYELKPSTLDQYRHPNISNNAYSLTYPRPGSDVDTVDISCKSKANNEIFLNYDGLVLPCCYLGTMHGQSPASEQLKLLDLSKYSLKTNRLDTILENMNAISDSWAKTVADGRLLMCAQTCGKTRDQHTKYGEINAG